MMHWSKMQSNVALSSAEAELNASVKGLSEIIGVYNIIRETQKVDPYISLHTDASACKGMLLRHGTGKVKHLSVKQLWSQEVVKYYNIQVHRVERVQNPADMLTHCVSFPVAERQLEMLNVRMEGATQRPMNRNHAPLNYLVKDGKIGSDEDTYLHLKDEVMKVHFGGGRRPRGILQ